MNFHKQLNHHDPENGVFGDCYRTAIAGLLGKHPSDVPHIYDRPASKEADKKAKEEMQAYLTGLGLRLFHVPFPASLDDVLMTQKNVNPGVFYLLSGQSKTGCNHTVIACDDQIVFDPSLTDAGIIGPCDDGYFWVELLCANPSAQSPENQE